MANSAFWGIKGLDHHLRLLKSQLNQFSEQVKTKIVRRAVKKGLEVIQSGIKGQIPPQFKEIKRLIGERFVSLAGHDDLVMGKVGVGVGAANKKTDLHRTHSGGVGISGKNVHWFLLGTGERTTKSGHYTGSMPPQVPNIVTDGFNASKMEAIKVVIAEIQHGIDIERAKVYAALRKASA